MRFSSSGLFDDRKLTRYACRLILVIALLACLIAALILATVNDVYAFIKRDQTVTVTLENAVSLSEFSDLLEDLGVVQNPHVFFAYAKLRGYQSKVEAFHGTVALNASMSYREILLLVSATS